MAKVCSLNKTYENKTAYQGLRPNRMNEYGRHVKLYQQPYYKTPRLNLQNQFINQSRTHAQHAHDEDGIEDKPVRRH